MTFQAVDERLRQVGAARAWPLVIFGLIAVLSVGFSFTGYDWAGWASVCRPDGCFCEAVRPGPVAQPSNTYSNLGFVLVGLLILGAARPAQAGLEAEPYAPNPMRGPTYTAVYGVAVVAIGLGSLFYHASFTVVGRWFDWMGMYLLASLIVLYNLARLRRMRGRDFALAYALANIALGAAMAFSLIHRTQVFRAMILGGLALEALVLLVRRPAVQLRYLLAALASFGLAYWIWTLDGSGTWCSPDSWLQGHAVWHLLTALSAGLLYVYYRSERPA